MNSTYAGVMREIPIVPLPVVSSSTLVRGMVVQWGSGGQAVGAWLSGATPALGVCVADADLDAGQVSVFVGKGCSVLIKCAPGIVANPNDFLFWSAPGLVSNVTDGNLPFARSIGVGFGGYTEAIII
jgi:hypothetical protein